MFGAFRVQRIADDGRATDVRLSLRKAESLLAYLALKRDPVSREKLAALLWGDVPDEDARRSLRVALSKIRSEAGEELLVADRQDAQLNPDADVRVDAHLLDDAIGQCLKGPDAHSAIRLARELDAYQGDLLSDFYDEWILPYREGYRERYLAAALALAQTFRQASDYERAIECARKALAADPANEEAHQQLMVCHNALGNRAAAVAQYESCARILRDELGVEPSDATRALYERILRRPAAPPPSARLTNLPRPITSFVGRARELDELRRSLTGADRIVTLTGVGGSGKTRLAIEAARALVDQFPDGVWWVDLTAASDGVMLARQVARAMGVADAAHVTPLDALIEFGRDRQFLLALDNCEHVIGDCAALVEQLAAEAPHARVLATSRESLNIAGERVYPVAPLPVPKPDPRRPSFALEAVAESDSVRLFAERATAVASAFRLDAASAPAVARICHRLDGIPLAIELAAARTRSMSLEDIATRLDDRFGLLTQGYRTALPRQQTLRATMDWSHDLLNGPERVLFRRLSVFSGGFTLAAVEAVCCDAAVARANALDLVSRLVDKSLVLVVGGGGSARYAMLETLRAYAADKLAESDEAARMSLAHCDHFSRMAADATATLTTSAQLATHLTVEAEIDNFRAALHSIMATTPDATRALRLCRDLGPFWYWRGYYQEGRESSRKALALAEDAGAWDEALIGAVLVQVGRLSYELRHVDESDQQLRTGARLAAGHGDLASAFAALDVLAEMQLHASAGDTDAAERYLAECIALARRVGHPIAAHLPEGYAAQPDGTDDQALKSAATRAYAAPSRLLTGMDVASVCNDVSMLHRRRGDLHAARAAQRHSLIVREASGAPGGLAITCGDLGYLALLDGDAAGATGYLERADALFELCGDKSRNYECWRFRAVASLNLGDAAGAAAFAVRSLQASSELGVSAGTVNALAVLVAIEAERGAHARAAVLLGALQRLREGGAFELMELETAALDRAQRALDGALSAPRRSAALAEGRAMSSDALLAFALGASGA